MKDQIRWSLEQVEQIQTSQQLDLLSVNQSE